ncbi:hypothetical protein RHSIM_Rhsim01G0128800 [Rhododendron simsii]|uniref:Transposase n=1 Tax=Rhododendron simsii TaxID=118357 RepID=A0A834LVH7_RHOSS|nr:hypothetical protein RHSIM_Rhsim01G0128800 [Rhododendron simsii]
MDKSWMTIKNRIKSKEYREGVQSFVAFAKENVGLGEDIWCPYVDCKNDKKQSIEVVKIHLMLKGISATYKTWVQHGESIPCMSPVIEVATHNLEDRDELPTMMEEVYRGIFMDDDSNDLPDSFVREHVWNFDRLFDDAQKPLHPGCKTYTVLSFTIKMLHIKVQSKWSNKSFDMNMKVIKDLVSECDETIPWTLREAKKYLRDLGLGYLPIHAFKYDCALFWKENENLDKCPKCGEPRYKLNKSKGKKIPHKILRYFPLIPRLKRLYMSKKIADDMRWHKEKRVDDDTLRHPADGEEWKNFDQQHSMFSKDARNVRLGLATDGFNPFGSMSSSYSMWPVIIMPYNLPPWKCMKEAFCMMSLLIPGKTAPGGEIDVYLRPLIDELKELWMDGVETYDASNGKTFRMHAAIMWTINDFPAYANLSGWSTKGYLACPICNKNASSQCLRSKIGYTGARRFLPENHIWRKCKLFNGKIETRSRPSELSGEEILKQIDLGTYKVMGKHPNSRKRKRAEDQNLNWNKKSILFELPYWKTLKLRHNLDVMHIEKNILDNLLGTLMSIDGKNKDTEKACNDLEDMLIRIELHLNKRTNGSFEKPPALYTLSQNERVGFCNFLKSIKFSDGYAANISNCVSTEGGKLSGLKSHDCHVLLQRLLPIGMRGYLNKELGTTIFELGSFFQQLCSKTPKKTDLDKLEGQIILILYKLEKFFPPAFFDVMVHLAIHLPREAILGGPVQYRWMYPIERLLGVLKGFVSNNAFPEGSIAEAYISKECTTFCSMYLNRIETVFNREGRNEDGGECGPGLAVFSQNVRPFGRIQREPDVAVNDLEMTHWFVLDNSLEVDHYLEEHKNLLRTQNAVNVTARQCKEFPKWFKDRMTQLRNQRSPEATDELWSLANGPLPVVNTYTGCISNGIRFHTIERDSRRKSQNSGLVVEGDNEGQCTNFYGHLCKVWELTYLFRNQVVLFQCEWFNTGGNKTFHVDAHCTSIDVRSRWYKDDPFVLPNQVQQVFYIDDTLDKCGNWKLVQRIQHRGIWDVPEMEDLQANDAEETHVPDHVFQQDETNEVVEVAVEGPTTIPLRRHDIDAEIIQGEAVLQSSGHAQTWGIGDNGFICDDNDEFIEELSNDEEEELLSSSDVESDVDSDFDVDPDIEP